MGSRYGVKIRKLEDSVLKIKRAKHPCPKCGKVNVKRKAKGLWHCNSCNATFTGGTYALVTQAGAATRKTVSGI